MTALSICREQKNMHLGPDYFNGKTSELARLLQVTVEHFARTSGLPTPDWQAYSRQTGETMPGLAGGLLSFAMDKWPCHIEQETKCLDAGEEPSCEEQLCPAPCHLLRLVGGAQCCPSKPHSSGTMNVEEKIANLSRLTG
jgi:hypothetical protein